jgi:hypothetical protein
VRWRLIGMPPKRATSGFLPPVRSMVTCRHVCGPSGPSAPLAHPEQVSATKGHASSRKALPGLPHYSTSTSRANGLDPLTPSSKLLAALANGGRRARRRRRGNLGPLWLNAHATSSPTTPTTDPKEVRPPRSFRPRKIPLTEACARAAGRLAPRHGQRPAHPDRRGALPSGTWSMSTTPTPSGSCWSKTTPNTHTPASLDAAFGPAEAKRLADRLEIHSTPKQGRWLTMAEIELAMLA